MQNSHGKAGEDKCALRQKSLNQANTASNLTNFRSHKNRTGLSNTSTNISSKQKSSAVVAIRNKAALNKSDLSKM